MGKGRERERKEMHFQIVLYIIIFILKVNFLMLGRERKEMHFQIVLYIIIFILKVNFLMLVIKLENTNS